MKTKPFLLATAGSTVDGRTIDGKQIDEMASSYNPATYGARVNIEHIRGISGDKPFRAYGDVLELSTGEVEVDFNGKKEKRKALYGVLDVTEDAKALNDASQKLYPSIEILPDFGGKGFAYLAGVALTDSPASIATERMKFNRQLPGAITLTATEPLPLELEPEAPSAANPDPTGIFASLKALADKFTGGGQQQSEQPAQPAAPAAPPANTAQTDAGIVALAASIGQLAGAVQSFMTKSETDLSALRTDLSTLKATVESTPKPGFTARPLATGGNGAAVTDC